MALANFSRFTTILLDVFSTDVAMLLANSAPGIVGGFPDLCSGAVMLGCVGWVRVIDCVAVPPPEPQWVGREGSVSENGFGAGALVGVKHEPQQLLVVGV